ncbi:hypothetical protein FOB82_10465 [Corynebacterium xerosis]|uniref:Uncharacterized protein n=1 Tax=Corynebacterium xerosis TaxID=1725 RepID=A0A6B8TK95_9CORY|nr:hypothetical protein [Corynebacterium xerosis]QGS35289.1 hypothetical protein FOB82_10465 [Corynebacterium xerosis]
MTEMKYKYRELCAHAPIDIGVGTSGRDGGDASETTLELRPAPGFQMSAFIGTRKKALVIDEGDLISISLDFKGDAELEVLREILTTASELLDELLAA